MICKPTLPLRGMPHPMVSARAEGERPVGLGHSSTKKEVTVLAGWGGGGALAVLYPHLSALRLAGGSC